MPSPSIRLAPDRILPLLLAAALAAASSAARADSLFAWGDNGGGQLGDGNTNNSSIPVPVSVLGNTVSAIAAGNAGYHGLALQGGSAYAWGSNWTGQLGNGTSLDSHVPVPVSLLSGVSFIAAGQDHSLAIRNGAAYAWGANDSGQLGNNTNASSSTPVPVLGLAANVTAVAGGAAHSLAIQNGAVFAWGANDSGQLGNGSTISSNTAVAVLGLPAGIASAIAAGNGHSLALQNGSVYAWGNNWAGQLGNNSTQDSDTAVAVLGLPAGISAIAAGQDHNLALCNGSVYAWGDNSNGELGLGAADSDPHSLPALVPDLSSIIAIAAGGNSSYALASNGTLYAWGSNFYGELGDGTTNDQYSPVIVTPPAGCVFTAIAAEGYSALALAAPAPVPEPAALALLSLAAPALLFRRRRS